MELANSFAYITSSAALKAFCLQISKLDFIAIDTEFIRINSYYPKLCLIQIGTLDRVVLIDPTAANIDLSCLYEILYNHKITKIIHSSSQDIEIFFNISQKIPYPIFDTQIAAAFYGLGISISFDKLIKHLLNITLDKSCQFSNWLNRPLTNEQKNYAANDVRYLCHIYQIIKQALQKNNRLTWLQAELELLNNPQKYMTNCANLLTKIKLKNSSPYNLSRAYELITWRETQAQSTNVLRKNILSDNIIACLAENNPPNIAMIIDWCRRNKLNIDQAQASKLLKIINYANCKKKVDCPTLNNYTMLQYDKNIYKLLKHQLSQTANQYNIPESIIARTQDLKKLLSMHNIDSNRCLHGWRKEIFGDKIMKILKNEKFFD